jgi:TetR/AcrR family transcriptional regulator, lmrAB and yxaGH operons repressor
MMIVIVKPGAGSEVGDLPGRPSSGESDQARLTCARPECSAGEPGEIMAHSARERMVASAVVLLAKRGFQGASFAEVLADSGAPRGSIYHHFPDGKEQLIAAAVDHAGAQAVQILDAFDGRSVVEIVDGFMAIWRSILERSGFTAGCSVLAVTVSADSRGLLNRAGEAFRSWQARLAELFRSAGLPQQDADAFATMLVAASEGAVVLARAQQALAPFETVHRQLRGMAAAYGTDT